MKRLISFLIAMSVMFSCVITSVPLAAAASNDYTTWRQSDSAWNKSEAWPSSQYPNATMRYMRQAGCVVTSIAMLLRHYNVVTDSNVNSFNPWVCNEKLKSSGVFNSAADVVWGNVSKAYPGFKYVGDTGYSASKLYDLYIQGYACIVAVNGYSHYVAVKSATSSNSVIMDPGWGYTSLSSFSSVNSIYYFSVTSSNSITHASCDKGEYVYYWKAHPHYNCYKCSVCGKIWEDRSSSRYIDDCSKCQSHTCDKGKYVYYWKAHPYPSCYKCSLCGEVWADHSTTNYVESCNSCQSHTCDKGEYVYFWKVHPHPSCYRCSLCGEVWANHSETNFFDQCEKCMNIEVTTGTASDITETTASLVGSYDNPGGKTITRHGFKFGTSKDDISLDASIARNESYKNGGIPGYVIKNLIPKTTYFYKAYVTTDEGSFYGEIKSFTTLERKQEPIPEPIPEPAPTPEPKPINPEQTSGIEFHFPRVTFYTQGQFTDVPVAQWFTSNVAEAVEFGLMKGDSDTTFNPYGDVTLAEAITMASRIHSIYITGSENFVQASGSAWYQVYLDYAYQNGIIGDSYFNGDVSQKATRAQYAEIFANALPSEGLYAKNSIADNAIPDVPTSMNRADSIYKLYRAGILAGGDVMGTFSPETYITRAESATIVARMADTDNRVDFTLS